MQDNEERANEARISRLKNGHLGTLQDRSRDIAKGIKDSGAVGVKQTPIDAPVATPIKARIKGIPNREHIPYRVITGYRKISGVHNSTQRDPRCTPRVPRCRVQRTKGYNPNHEHYLGQNDKIPMKTKGHEPVYHAVEED
ncbi:hypothetical protein BDZ97DRAFT_1761936 [Flammula alnicola]|nr:hypothetical protein BDZ97DRAFT_1761936 [Flammula alnicola]